MKILQLIPKLGGGGAERLVVDLSNKFAEKHDVTLLTVYDSGTDDLYKDQILSKVDKQSLEKRLGFDWRVILKLYKVIKKIEPDVIHSHLGNLKYLMPCRPFLGNFPLVYTVHSDAFKEYSNGILRKVRKQFFKMENVAPVTISDQSAVSFEEAYTNIDHTLIYNGRSYPKPSEHYSSVKNEVKKYKSDEQTKVFVNIGRIAPSKNLLMLVEAFKRFVEDEHANARLLIIGGSVNTHKRRKIHKQLKREEKKHPYVHILGECPNATDYLHVADFFCLSSLWEGMPFALIEAFAVGCIPICTSVGGVTEMVEALDASLLAESTGVDDYNRALKRVYDFSPDKQQSLKKRAKQLFRENYSIEQCAAKYLELYKSLIE